MRKKKGLLIASIIISLVVLVALFISSYMLHAEVILLKELETNEESWVGLGLVGILIVMIISSLSGSLLSLVIFSINIIRVLKIKEKKETLINSIFAYSSILVIVIFVILNIIFYALV